MFTVALLMAMQAEADPILQQLSNQVDSISTEPLPIKLYGATMAPDFQLMIGLNGKDAVTGVDNIGSEAATLTTQFVLNKIKPDLVINAGTAGGFKEKGGKIGDIYLGFPHIIFHDRRIPLPGFDHYGLGLYPTPGLQNLATRLRVKTGVISTGNSLDHTTRDMEIMQQGDAAVKEMEAAAIAWVCRLYNTPLIALKAITDLVDTPTAVPEQFVQNLATASNNLAAAVFQLLQLIQSVNSIDDLFA